jgi:hypothetical protein
MRYNCFPIVHNGDREAWMVHKTAEVFVLELDWAAVVILLMEHTLVCVPLMLQFHAERLG